MSLPSTSLSTAEISYIVDGLVHSSSPTRADGRQLLQPLPIEISYGDAPQASGSARVRLGSTEVLAGVRLEVEDVEVQGKGKQKAGWLGRVEVDITPQAYPSLGTNDLSRLATMYASLISDHFIPSAPPLPILPPTKYFVPYLHLTVLSASSACVTSALLLASRASFSDLRVPIVKRIGYEGATTVDAEGDETDLSGIKAAVRAARGGKGKSRAVGRGGEDWDLEGGETFLENRENLPVVVVLNLTPKGGVVFLDATPQEEAACPDRVLLFFTGSGKLCGMRVEGTSGVDIPRIPALLQEGKRIAQELVDGLNAEMPK